MNVCRAFTANFNMEILKNHPDRRTTNSVGITVVRGTSVSPRSNAYSKSTLTSPIL
jgi:hypothetical protein